MKTDSIKKYMTQLYRRYSLRKDTPPILRTLYADRKGSLTELKQRFGEDEVRKNIYLGKIKTISDDTYQTTNNGIEDIQVFYKKQSPFQMIQSILFGILSKIY